MTASNKPFWIMMSLLASTSFALIAPFAIYAEAEGLLPPYAVLFRYILLVGIATPFVVIFARQHFKFTRQQFWLLMLQSCATAILNVSYMAALSYIPLSLAVIIFYTQPMMTLMVVPLIYGGRLNAVKVIIFVIAFLGLIMVVGPQFSNLDPIGITLAALAAITAVIQLLCMVKLVKEINPIALLYSVQSIAMLITFVIMYFAVTMADFPMPVAFTSGMTFNFIGVVICYSAGYIIFLKLAKNLEPATIAFLGNFEPILTIILAILLFNESLSTIQAIGAAVVITALVVGSLYKEKPAT